MADTDAGYNDNQNLFIWFLVFAVMYSFVYLLMACLTNTRDLHGWRCHLAWYRYPVLDKKGTRSPGCQIGPCLGDCNRGYRKICSARDDEDGEHRLTNEEKKCESHLPGLFRALLFWCPHTSRCHEECMTPKSIIPSSQREQKSQLNGHGLSEYQRYEENCALCST